MDVKCYSKENPAGTKNNIGCIRKSETIYGEITMSFSIYTDLLYRSVFEYSLDLKKIFLKRLVHSHTHTHTHIYIYICIIIIIIIIIIEFLPQANTGGLSSKSEWEQVSSSLQDSFKYSILS